VSRDHAPSLLRRTAPFPRASSVRSTGHRAYDKHACPALLPTGTEGQYVLTWRRRLAWWELCSPWRGCVSFVHFNGPPARCQLKGAVGWVERLRKWRCADQ
jgi:hypothetical protein